jgi:hypothetical protein
MAESVLVSNALENRDFQQLMKITGRNNIIEAVGEIFGVGYELQFEETRKGTIKFDKKLKTSCPHDAETRMKAMSQLRSYIMENEIHRFPAYNFGTIQRTIRYLLLAKEKDPDKNIRSLAEGYIKDVLDCDYHTLCESCLHEGSCPLHNPEDRHFE